MTPEEKARAYDKALEKARMYRDNAKAVEDYSAVARYENIFPELRKEERPLTPFQLCLNCILRGAYYAEVPDEKVNDFILSVVRTRTDELIKLAKIHEYTDCQLRESEDEKIRKEIINYLNFAESHNLLRAADYKKKKGWIDWLEKHKDAFENNRQLGIMQEQARKELECPDEKNFTIYHPLKNGKGKYECIPYSFYGSLTSFSEGKDLIDFLRTCFYTKEECNEWIKQQEQKHPDGCFTCDEYKKGYEAGRLNGITAGYNKAMKEQKPAWSEKDEKIRQSLLRDYEYAIQSSGTFWGEDFKKKHNWLKSLRPCPSWKPSKEQMNYLCATVDAAIRKHNESVSGYEPARVLKSLYEDLQKLM